MHEKLNSNKRSYRDTLAKSELDKFLSGAMLNTSNAERGKTSRTLQLKPRGGGEEIQIEEQEIGLHIFGIENEQSKGSFSGNRDAHNLLEQRSANAERTFKRARAYPFG